MKIYNNVSFLQNRVENYCGKKFDKIFKSNLTPRLTADEEYNFVIKNNLWQNVDMDSTTAYQLSDYYKILGDAIKRIEDITNQSPEVEYKSPKKLNILFDEPFISFVNKEFKTQKNMKDETYRNSIEGIHEDGLGWAPNGDYCGECSFYTCIGCPNADGKIRVI